MIVIDGSMGKRRAETVMASSSGPWTDGGLGDRQIESVMGCGGLTRYLRQPPGVVANIELRPVKVGGQR